MLARSLPVTVSKNIFPPLALLLKQVVVHCGWLSPCSKEQDQAAPHGKGGLCKAEFLLPNGDHGNIVQQYLEDGKRGGIIRLGELLVALARSPGNGKICLQETWELRSGIDRRYAELWLNWWH